MKKEYKIAIVFLLIIQGVFLFRQSYSLGISLTPSLPYTIFLMDKKDKEFEKNDLIVFKYPGENIYSYKTGEQFVKIATCFPGDKLIVTLELDYFCNDIKIGKGYQKDSDGKDLKHFIFNGFIPENNYFVTGTHPKSWDSKYWGFVSKDSIIGTAKGLL